MTNPAQNQTTTQVGQESEPQTPSSASILTDSQPKLSPKPRFKFIFIFIFGLLVLSAIVAGAVVALLFLKPQQDVVAITVNGEKITKRDLDHRYQLGKYFYESNAKKPIEASISADLAEETKEYFIEHLLMKQELAKVNIRVTEEDVGKEMEKRAQDRGGLDAYLAMYKNNYHWEVSDVKHFVEHGLMKEKVIENFLRASKLRIIWIQSPIGDATEDKITPELKAKHQQREKYAQTILEKAKRGEDFVTLVRKYSEDEVSKAKDGDVGFYSADMRFPLTALPASSTSLVKPTKQPSMAVFANFPDILTMTKGEIRMFSQLSGFSIVKVEDTKGGNFSNFKEWYKVTKSKADIKIYINQI